MVEMIGAKALVETLKQLKVEVMFGYPGGAIMPVYDELYDSGIRHILVRHEQHAAHMADGYARVSGRPGICIATSGPGSTNLITGIATAYMDSSPVVALTGQVPTYLMGTMAFQETDMVGLCTPITKWAVQARRPSEIPKLLKAAYRISMTGRPGPVLLDLPKDAQVEAEEIDLSEEYMPRGVKPVPPPDPEILKKAAEMIAEAEKPVIIAGGGVKWAKATEMLMRLAELLPAPVATTFMGKGSFPETHPLSLQCVGMHGNPAAHEVIQKADLLIVVGARFSDRTTSKMEEFGESARIIHIDIDASEVGKNKDVDLAVVGSADQALKGIVHFLEKIAKSGEKTAWMKRVEEIREKWDELVGEESSIGRSPVSQYFKSLREATPSNTIVSTEVGQNQMWAEVFWRTIEPYTFISSGGLGTMGFGFPAAIGAKVAKPDAPVIDIAGDGSFMMNENNLAVVSSENIPVIVVIFDNRMLGMVAQWQRLFYDRRYMGVQLPPVPDFVKLAESYDVEGVRAESPEELRKAVVRAMRNNIPIVIDVPISPEEDVYPFVPPGRSLSDVIIKGRSGE